MLACDRLYESKATAGVSLTPTVMSVGGLVLLAAIWCIIYVFHHFYSSKTAPLLPSNLGQRYHHTTVTLNPLHLRVSTTRWNTLHDQLATFLSKRGNKQINSLLGLFYNLGSVLGAIGMVTGVVALCWMTSTSGLALLEKYSERLSSDLQDAPVLVSRAIEDSIIHRTVSDTPSRFPTITPIIPGVTVPLIHLPIIILAVFISQVVHEMGHAIAAARESLPMLSSGASFTFCIPAAFVTFPTAGIKSLRPEARSRVVAAGPFHNLAFWCLLIIVTRLGVVNIVGLVSGYKNVSDIGRVVVNVNVNSPLFLHLTPGSIVTKLDDTPLSSLNTSTDAWTAFLTGERQKLTMGWCISKQNFDQSQDCCTSSSLKGSVLVCFTAIDRLKNGCIDPVPVLTEPNDDVRCASDADCSSKSQCVLPSREIELIRLRVRPPSGDETIVLWSGPPEEVYEEVQVDHWYPRIWFLPFWIPSMIRAFWEYLLMAMLSLYIFNLLPLPYLDGAELLTAFLHLAFEWKPATLMYDIESLEGGVDVQESTRTRRRWKATITRFVQYGLVGTLVLYMLFAAINILG